ncbi:transposase [Nonomuraea solani]|uniref:transposase n=1 Tax=Nonomuraea solani TaxID=1144553 RepID=UPI000CDE9669|nr:transposase [Nonomuraea solani]
MFGETHYAKQELVTRWALPRCGASLFSRQPGLLSLMTGWASEPTSRRPHPEVPSKARLADACFRLRPSADLADPAQSVKAALRHLAARYRALSAEIDTIYNQLKALIEQARPELLTAQGVGVETAAQLLATCGDNPDRLRSEGSFAALCGVSPVPASSGKTRRHRLNHGGDRQNQPGPVRHRAVSHVLRSIHPHLR